MRQDFTIDSGPPHYSPKQGGLEETQTNLKTPSLVSKLSRVARLTLSYWSMMLMLTAQLPQATAQTYSSCASGWYHSGSACYPYYGGYSPQSGIPAGYYGFRGATGIGSCAAGFDCSSSGQEYPIACSPGTYSAAGTSGCSACPSSNPCSASNGNSACSAGYYTFNGSGRWKVCQYCPAGYTCAGSSNAPVIIPTSGTYTTNQASSASGCAAGYYCPDPSRSNQLACPQNHYSAANAGYCTQVADGYYSTGSGQATCPAGYYIGYGSNACQVCPAGFYCLAGSDNPIPCNAGSYSTGYGTTAACTACPYQYYCSTTAVTTTCGSGYTSKLGDSMCTKCEAGYYCSSGAQTACSTNYWSTIGATGCTIDQNGYGKDSLKESVGQVCGVGYYSTSATSYDCTVCPQGYYCTAYTSAPVACGSSYYCPPGTADQTSTPCPDWYDCTNYLMCDDGQYLASDKVTCTACPAGYTCAGRSISTNVAVNSGAGYYSPSGVSPEFLCPAGFACSTNVAVECADGEYSIESDLYCIQCPLYWACPSKQLDYLDQIDCRQQRGMYGPSAGQVGCTPADPGYYIEIGDTSPTQCPEGTWSTGAVQSCHECPPGYICPSKVQPEIYKCNVGTYNLLYNQIVCLTCEAGFYCDGESRGTCPTYKYSYQGWGYCIFAEQGYYLDTADQTEQYACPTGTYAIFGSGDSTLGSTTCQTCPVGHICVDPALPPQVCPPGSYQPATGQTTCLSCPAGTYSLFRELECHVSPAGYKLAGTSGVPRMCHAGTYSDQSASSCITTTTGYYTQAASTHDRNLGECPWGFYCSSDGSTQIEYPNSYYNNGVGSIVGGYYYATIAYGVGVSTSYTACDAGYYCPYGTMKRYPCPAGHYCAASSSLPTPCPAGYFNIQVMMTAAADCTNNPCPLNYYCNIGSKYPQPCSGTCDASLMAPAAVIVTCLDGTYSGNDSPLTAGDCNACWEGHYCASELATEHTFPIPCPKGTWSSSTSASLLSECQTCPVGMVCPYLGQRSLETGLVCQGGHACPAGTMSFRETPCLEGFYSDATPYLDDASNCIVCPDGFMCTEATNVLYNPMTVCEAGYYCIAGVQTECPIGTYSTQIEATSDAVCLPCPAGFYCDVATTDYSANVCDVGYYCPEGSSTATPYSCPDGSYSTLTGMKSSTECTICPIGYYVLVGEIIPVVCPAGTYSSRISLIVEVDGTDRGCLTCPAGYYCSTEPTFEPIACPVGSYSAAGALICEDCPLNYYCDNEATTDSDYTLIEDGFYYAGGVGLDERPYHISTTYSCQPGYYCAANVQTACAAGTYQPLYGQTVVADCLTTPAGYYNNAVASTDFFDYKCPTGMYCHAGTSSAIGYALTDGRTGYPFLCPKGTFRSIEMAKTVAECGECPAGYVCSELTTSPLICSPGYYCPQGSESMQACPTGTFGSGYGLTTIDDCSPCFGGRYCSAIAKAYVSGLCDQMYYCVQNSNSPVPLYKTVGSTTDFQGRTFPVGDECAAGGYCAAGSKFPLPCPAGQYNPDVRAEVVTQCKNCPAGEYCSGAPTDARTDILDDMKPYVPAADPTGDCYAGYYCIGAAYSPKQFTAQAGKWTAAGASAEEDCALGTYNPYTAQSSCLPCPAGYYCDATGMSAPLDCPLGYYCPAGLTDFNDHPCPSSTYGTETNLQDDSECQSCTSGRYCFGTGQTADTGDCLAGYYCLGDSEVDNPDGSVSDQNDVCPSHHWCDTGVGMGVPSLPGFYDAATQQTAQSTTQQTQGYYSHTVSDTSTYFSSPIMTTGDCAIGYYCPAGSTWGFDEAYYCDVTMYCPANSFQTSTCVAGFYQPNPLQDRCFACPAGFYCPTTVTNDLTTFKCPKGYFCPEQTASEFENPCPAGTYNDHFGATSDSECVDAPPGYYQSGTAATEITAANLCTAGYFCEEGSDTPTPAGNICTAGNYCPSGSPKMIQCTTGQKCTTGGLGAPDADCVAGFYCPQGTSSTGSLPCPVGFYCPTASPRPLPCPAGTYQPSTQQDDASDCIDCVESYYCPEAAMTAYTSYPCLAGFYCPTGSRVATQIICSIGNYCTSQQFQETACSSLDQYQDETGASDCKNCPSGHFCDDTSLTKCQPQLEGLNYYCPGGVVSVGKIDCNDGYYNFVDGSDSINDCWICPEGYFCPNDATTIAEKIQICTKGYYCLAATETPTICPIGFYCPEGTNVPIPCPAGYYGDTAGFSTAVCSGGCSAGFYCDKVAYTPAGSNYELCLNEDSSQCYSGSTSPTQSSCTQGHYCNAGTIIPTPCPIGTYSAASGNDEAADCIDCTGGSYCYSRGLTAPQATCEAGYYCPEGSDDAYAEECPTGYMCPTGSAEPVICSQGTYQANEVQSSCSDCPIGWYCDEEGMTLPLICPTGYFCATTNIITPVECPVGTWSYTEGLTAQINCMPCPYGKYCTWTAGGLPITTTADATECPELYSCYDTTSAGLTLAEMTAEHLCVAGEVCAANTIVPEVCEPGQYANPAVTTGVTTSTDLCVSCPVEKYCPDWGLDDSNLEDCPDGYVCLGGAIHPSNLDDVTIKLCPSGSYCKQIPVAPDTQIENLCKFNYYNPIEGQSECFPCEAGFSCQETGLVTPDPCPTGHYCPLYDSTSGIDNVVPCPAGTYNYDEYLTAEDQCVDCPPGKYCEEGTSVFTGFCDEGYVCTGGQGTATPTGVFDFVDYTNAKSGPCPVGHYCPYGSSYPRKCPSGQYQDETGQHECEECEEGYYCAEAGLSSPTGTCSPGFYCIEGSVFYKPYDFSSGRICAQGHYCVTGLEFDCPSGSYSPVEGLSLCYKCPPGFYCNKDGGTIAPIECTTGNYCPEKTSDPIPCEEGTYTQSYMKGLESQDQCADCPSGYYCDDGTFDRTQKCDAGYYCHSGAYEADQDGLECAPGYYCPQGAKLPVACPDGKYSVKGAESEDDCTDCKAGYYCVRYVSSAAMLECPVGYYCPDGVNEPLPCPKGTYNTYTKSVTIDRCLQCPKGTACDVVGISNYNRKMCPPGYYCEKGTFAPQPCPAGLFRPNQGAGEIGPVVYNPNAKIDNAACYSCVPGYYCPTKATVVPELCPRGSYCKIGSQYDIKCPPGYYCNSGSAAPTKCPESFYCLGSSDTYLKCPFGTYCPEKSSRPIPCPNGMYGSGSVNNIDEESGCKECGRGMYSENDPTQCNDCTPGYVCLGKTSSATPIDKTAQGGFMCPVGFYCPLGSYEASYCPVGTYSKKEGSKSVQKCLPCKVDWYNDLPGQGGCKKCGPTSTADGGATTCQCVGADRDFIKSVGSCLCATGFKPKNGASNVDSTQDCEQIVKEVCPSDMKVDLTGKCVDANEEKKICAQQCPGSSGTFVDGTGLCQCEQLTDKDQVCDRTCAKQMLKVSLSANGTMTILNPVPNRKTGVNEVSIVDPSSIPGYYGSFKCETTNTATTDCKVLQMGMAEDGSFTYEFSPNEDITNTTNMADNNRFRTDTIRKVEALRKIQLLQGRSLQTTVEQTTTPRLKNPAMCIKEGDVIFFNVVAEALNYPVYYKDSFLNNNPYFDYGPFLELEKMIQQGVYVSTFSFIFKDAGVYVFTNKASGTMTSITVVLPSQECEGQVDGVSVSMVTKESLASFGVKSGDKGIQPDWWFNVLVMIAILSLLFLIMGLFLRAHNTQIKGTKLLDRQTHTKSASIYYDKIMKAEKNSYKSCCCGLYKYRVTKVNHKNDSSSDSSDLDQTKKIEYAVKYKDLEKLLADFNRAQEVLNRQLIDTEGANKRTLDEDGNLVESLSNEDSLLKEVQALMTFVKQNRQCLNNALGEKPDQAEVTEAKLNENIANSYENQYTRKVANAMTTLIQKGIENEKTFHSKIETKAKDMQKQAYEKEAVRNDQMKQKLLNEYEKRLLNKNVNEKEREALLAELHAKMSHINDLAAEEQHNQNHNLNDLLARRRAKKEKLQVIVHNLGDKKVSEEERYQNTLLEIRRKELDDKKAVDQEMDDVRKEGLRDIQQDLDQKRLKSISDSENRLEDFKRKQGKGHNPEADAKFADMLAEYGNQVKKLDSSLSIEKQKQVSGLDDQIKNRKQARLREVEEQRKQKEQLLNSDTVNNNAKLTTEMKQLECLLNPIKDEDARMEIILSQNKPENVIVATNIDKNIELSSEAKKAKSELQKTDEDKKVIAQILVKIDVENEVKRREIENQKEMINRQLQNCNSEDERQRLLKQLEIFDTNLQAQLAQQQELQNKKLKEAIEARKQKRRVLKDSIAYEKELAIKKEFQKSSKGKVLAMNSQDKVKQLANRIQAGFSKDEAVQVTENLLDQKAQQEAVDLMNSLFEERAKALRQFMLDSLTQKQQEFDDLADEYEPQKEFLRQKRVKQLLTLEEFTAALERITVEETERHQDIQIAYADKEKQIKEELELLKMQADNEQMKSLKDRQTQEKILMYQELMKNMDDKDQMKVYLTKSVNEANRDLDQYKRHSDKEKQSRVQDMQADQERKQKEMEERQDRLVNVEEMLKKDEAKHMERFRRQREEMLARKLGEQQRELLKDMNQKDVDQMLDRHKRDLGAMDEVLQDEQQRQMVKMRDRMMNRNAAKAKEQVLRQIKLAEIQKEKQREAEQAKLYEQAGGDLATSVALEKQKAEIGRLVEKASLMQRMCQKQCYSRKIYFKRHIANQQKLNSFLGRGIMADWASSKGGYPDDVSGMSQLSLKTEDLKQQVNDKEEKITYATLLQHIQTAQETYDQIRKQDK